MADRDESDDDTKENEPNAAEHDDADDGDSRDEAADDESEAAEAAAEERPRKKRKAKHARDRERHEPPSKSSSSSSSVGVFVALALAVGAAGGWFGHVAQVKAKLKTDSAPAASGSAAASGPCGTWEQKLCASGGPESALCQQAKAAREILTPGTCEVALEAVPATLAKVKAERAPCDQLMTKLCADLPPESQACKLVKDKTPAFPAARCKEMLDKYSEVLGELKQIDEQMAAQGNPLSNGMPGMPPGMPPGAPGGPGGPGDPHDHPHP